MDRKLSAILAADVVGYSALMERDEKGTHERLKAGRKELFEPEIALHHGRVFKLMGDGLLAEFGSVVDAVECAVSLQRGLADRNAAVPEDQRIQVRIGINLGEVIVEGDDRYGEGVNIAARLEQLAEPGGIWVSDKVAREVEKKLAFGFEAMGPQYVKNIAEPIQAYRVRLDASPVKLRWPLKAVSRRPAMITLAAVVTAAVGTVAVQSWAPWLYSSPIDSRSSSALSEKPSLVVLPFTDFGGDQGYFAEGMTEDLITDLAKLSGLFVISRNSSWVYKGKSVTAQQVAQDLGVRYVVEGSVRREGDIVRINAQLIDAHGGQHLWADRYDGSMKEVFALQDKVIRQIVAALAVNLSVDERAEVERIETRDPEAYDALLQGWGHYRRDTESDTNAAIALFRTAIERDPSYARGHAALAAALWRIAKSNWESATQGGFQHAFDEMNLHLAQAFKQPIALAHAVSAEVLSRQGRYDEAFVEIGRAMELGPNDPDIFISKARILSASGKADEAEAAVRAAMRLDPQYPPDYLRVLGLAQFHQGRYAEAVETMRTVVSRQSDVAEDYATITACLGLLGRTEGVADAIKHYGDLTVPAGYAPMTVAELSRWWWYGDIFDYHAPYLDRLEEGLRKAGVPEGAGDLAYPQYRAVMHKALGEYVIDGATKIDFKTAKSMRDRGVIFVDARTSVDFDRGHIPGAVNINVQTALSRETLGAVASKDREVVFSCHGKFCPDSAVASAKAVVWGYTHVYYFAGGYPAWKDAGYPVETSAGG